MSGCLPVCLSIYPLPFPLRVALAFWGAEKEGCSQAGSLEASEAGRMGFPWRMPPASPQSRKSCSLPVVSSDGNFLLHLHSPLQSLCVCVRAHLIIRSCPTLWNPMDCSPPGSSVHGILQARRMEWVAIPSFRGSSQPRNQTQVSRIAGGFFTI